MNSSGAKLQIEWNNQFVAVACTIALTTFIYLGLLFFFPPSFVQLSVAGIGGLFSAICLIRIGLAKWKSALAVWLLTMVVLGMVCLALTRPVSTGMVVLDKPFSDADAFLKANGFSGSVLIARDSQILLTKGYGYANRTKLVPNTSLTQFRLGSVSKQFVAVAVLVLQAKGELNVRDPICDYLPDCPPAWRDITIHHLLSHTSGLSDYLIPCMSNEQQVQGILADAKNQPLAFAPGSQVSYSNLGYDLLGDIVERVSGEPLADFLQHYIFGPLQMNDSVYDPDVSNDLATGYTNAFLPACPIDVSMVHGAGGIVSTTEDLYRWDRALDTEQLIPQELLGVMFTAYGAMPDNPGLSAGYGWVVGQQFDRRVMMHGGFIQGFTSVIARYPDDKLTIIILSNQQNYPVLFYREICEILFSALP